jgi:nucleotide-binding universal stress UspA family protein
VRQQLRETGTVERGLQEIPLDAIVGSVGRSDDFTHDFMPKKDSDQERWAQVRTAVLDMSGMAPISVYQMGEGYFVRDGNHRVSIARQLGTPTISAYVTEVRTRVPLAVDDKMDAVSHKARYVEFLEETKLDELRPEANLLLTLGNHYHLLDEQIETHRRRLAEEEERAISGQEAMTRWYDQIYLPVVEIIREQGILRNFPRRTEADLYLLFVEHRQELARALGWRVDPEETVADLARRQARAPRSVMGWLGMQLVKMLIPDELEAGPEPGRWRQERLARRKCDCLFADILVSVQPEQGEWCAMDQAVMIATRENGHLLGLHVIPDKESDHSRAIGATRSGFKQRRQAAGLGGELTVEVGDVAGTILKRAAWADLVVVRLAHPPESQPLSPFSAGLDTLIQRCPRPILVVPTGVHSPMDRALLAYDGSSKADEALFVAAYLASRWPISLAVVTVETNHTSAAALQRAKTYLDEHVAHHVTYSLRQKPIAEAVLATAEAQGSNLLIMGGFGFRPVLNLVLGSTVDQVLREFGQPVMVCR